MATKQFQNAKLNVTHLDLKDDASRSVLQSGENISHSLGKIARWYKDIIWTDSKATTEVFGIVKLSDDYKSESTETVPTSKTLNDVVKLIKQTGGWNTTYDFNSNIEGDENLQNGQFKVTEHDLEGDIDHYVSIKGLGSAAFTESSAYATAGHTHKYAGSASVGGPAISANKLNTDAGSDVTPIYFSNGIPVACTYSLNKTVPSNALFTDAKVTQTATTTDADYEILFSSTADNTTRTEGARKNSNLTFNPSTGILTATKFVGVLSGNATTATTANKLSNTTAIGSSIKPVYFSADGIPVAIDHSIETSVPSNAVFTDTTYTVSSGDSNGQIKVTPSVGDPYNVSVKGLGSAAYTDSDEYAMADHTHKYAGSSSVGGVANSAAKLSDIPTAGIGSETKPVFFSGTTGRPVACTYSLNTTVPANAIFTDEKVKQSPVTTDGSFEVLFAVSTGNTEKTEGVGKTTTLTFNPSTGALSATSFSGNGSGLTTLNASNISSGTLSVNRLPGSAVTVGTYGPAAGGTLSHSGTFDVPDFTVDAKGRVTGAHTRTFTLPTQYTHPTHTSKTSGLYKITVDGLGHVSATASVTKTDIPVLDYVSSTTTRNANTVLAGPISGAAAAPTFRTLVANDLPSHTHTKSDITDFPTSLKNPNSLTVQGNGTASFTYDGSVAKTLNIKPGTGISVSSDTSGNITITNTSTNTDTKVTQTATTTNANYEVLFSGTADNTTRTEGARKNSNLTFNPSTGILQITATAYGAIEIYRKGSANGAAIRFYNDATTGTKTKLGSIGMKDVDGDIFRYLVDETTLHKICDTKNTSFTASLTSGTKIGTIKIGGTSTDLYCQTNTDNKVTAVGNHYTPSGGTTTSASGGTLTDITNSSSGIQVVTGVTKDAAGHVTGVTSKALKSVNTNTTYSFASGDSNGQIKVTPSSGTAYNVSVKGLGSAAYTASTKYVYKDNTSDTLSQFDGAPSYLLGIESFTNGGTVKWQSASSVSVGSATKASKLSTARTINGVKFDGTADIIVPRSIKHIHYANGTNGSSGYVKICTVGTNAAYGDQPIRITIGQRRISVYDIFIVFENSASAKATIRDAYFRSNRLAKQSPEVHYYLNSNGYYDIYVKKTESQDHIFIMDYLKSDGDEGDHVELTWTNTLVSTLPSGSVKMLNEMDKYYLSTISRGANTVLAAPNGSAGSATFRALVAADLPASGATAGSYGPSANATPGYGATFNVPYITVDAKGRVTSISNKTVKIPASDNTNTTYALSGAYGSGSNTWVTTLTPSSGSATTSTVPVGTTSAYGLMKLYNGVDSTSTALAATANAVKTAYDYKHYIGSTRTDGTATAWSYLAIKEYDNAYPDGMTLKKYGYGGVITLSGGNSRLELYANHNSSTTAYNSNGIQFRTGWVDDKKPWRMLLDNVNYSSYITPAEIGASASDHSHPYLPLDGGTMTGNITFAGVSSTEYPALSNQIYFSGSTDWARILYEVTASDAGQLVFETGDDANAKIVFRNKVTSGGTYTRQVTIADGVISGNGSGLTSLNASNISSGTLSADRLATSGVTAGSYGPSANATPGYGSTFNVPYITVDAKGRVTAISTKTVKIPASDNTNTTYTFATGDNNGTFKVTPSGGSAKNIAIKGLGSAAYTASSAYATSGHTHNYAGSSTAGGPAKLIAMARVKQDSKVFPGQNRVKFEEYTAGDSYNLPTNAWYHIISMQGSDTGYGTQIAVGMTANKKMYFRNYNASSWQAWNEISIVGHTHSYLSTTTKYALSSSVGGPAYSVEGSEGTDASFRHVWFSTSNTETRRAYSDKFMFEPSLGILKFNSWYPLDITDNTVDLNSYNDGSGKYGYRRYICRSTGGGNKISNKPCDSPFLLEVFLIRFATASSDYITKQVYHAFNKKTYQRFCTNGTWDSWTELKYTDTNTDTKNTAGSTNTSSKIFLIGATSQAANPQTYSHDTAYVGTDGCLYSNSTKVSVEGHAHGLGHSNFTVAIDSTTNTWAAIGVDGTNKYVLKSIRTNTNAPPYLLNDFSAGIVFGGEDTRGVISMKYDTPSIRFAGGNRTAADGGTAKWYITLTGTHNTTYNLDTMHQVTQTATTTSAAYEVLFSGTADNTTRTEGARKNSNLTFNPSTGVLTATKFDGQIVGKKYEDYDPFSTKHDHHPVLFYQDGFGSPSKVGYASMGFTYDSIHGELFSGGMNCGVLNTKIIDMSGTTDDPNSEINYKGTKATHTMIKFVDNAGDTSGNGIVIGGGGLVVVGAGESANNLVSAASLPGGQEKLYLTSDSEIYFYVNCNTIGNRKGMTLNTSLHLYPNTNNIGTVGTSSNKWNAMYATTFYGALSGNANTATTASTAKKLKYCTLCNEASDAATYPWYRIAYAYTTSAYSDLNLVMMVTCGFGSKWGIFKARARTEGTAGTFGGTVTIEWIVNHGFTNAQLYLLVKNNYQVDTAKSGTATAEIWFKSDGRYWGYTFTVLHEGWRTGTASDLWALSSYTKNGSENYNKNASGIKSATSKSLKTATTTSNTGWTNNATDDNIIPTMSFMAYWNGRYNSSNSNLQYCDRGRFGTIITAGSGDYVKKSKVLWTGTVATTSRGEKSYTLANKATGYNIIKILYTSTTMTGGAAGCLEINGTKTNVSQPVVVGATATTTMIFYFKISSNGSTITVGSGNDVITITGIYGLII